jgi:hypothetical protein
MATYSTDFSTFTIGADIGDNADWTKVPAGSTSTRGRLNALVTGGTYYLSGSRDGTWPVVYARYEAPDPGSADHYAAARYYGFQTSMNAVLAVRLVDVSNYVGMYLTGTGAIGLRSFVVINGASTDTNVRTQGVADGWIKIEADGDQYTCYLGGNGATPSWAQAGSSFTVSGASIPVTETSVGIANKLGTPFGSGATYIQAFESGALGGGGTTISADVEAGAAGVAAALTRSVVVTSTPMQAGPASVTADVDLVNQVDDGDVAAGAADVSASLTLTRKITAAPQASPADVSVTVFVVDGTVDVTDGDVAAGAASVSADVEAFRVVTDGDVVAGPADVAVTLTRTVFVTSADVMAGAANVSAAIGDGSFTPDAFEHGNVYGGGVLGVA